MNAIECRLFPQRRVERRGAASGCALRSPGEHRFRTRIEHLDFTSFDIGAIQTAWALLILTSPLLCWRCGRRVGVGALSRAVAVVGLSVALSLVAVWQREDAPLHANGHAWREAKEILAPAGERSIDPAPFLHGEGGIALEWLVARAERALRGTANPFRISRLGAAAAAGATAFLVIVLVGSPWAGLAAGCVFALMPLAQMLAVSGSLLAVPAWLLPWSLALWIAAGLYGDFVLLAGAALAAALGTLSHTAMLAWLPALFCGLVRVLARRYPLELGHLRRVGPPSGRVDGPSAKSAIRCLPAATRSRAY